MTSSAVHCHWQRQGIYSCRFCMHRLAHGQQTKRDTSSSTMTCHITCRSLLSCAVTSGSQVTVMCARKGVSQIPANFQVTVTARSGQRSCASSGTHTTTLSSSCCVTGTTYGYNPTGVTCLSALGCTNGGFINTIASGTPTYQMARGATCPVAPVGNVGSVQVSCTANTAATSTVVLDMPNQVMAGTAATSFYVGCVAPSGTQLQRCNPTNVGGPTCASATVRTCGGALTATRTVRLSCACTAVRWIVASTISATPGSAFIAERLGTGSCPA